jgi:hypothetical protein
MGESRKRADWPIIVAVLLALVLAPLAIYVGGYFAVSRYISDRGRSFRRFEYAWQGYVFFPAATVESLIRGEEVLPVWP